MRVELEFGLKFVIDPGQPITPQEIRALDQAYVLFREMQSVNSAEPDQAARGVRAIRYAAALQALNRQGGDKSAAARDLGISRALIHKWLKEGRGGSAARLIAATSNPA